MKVLVIGGAGYIGSHAVYELIRAKHEVVVMDNLSTGYKEFVHKDAKFYLGDITKKEDLNHVFKEECSIKPFDVVMHFAAKLIVPESVEKPLEYYYNNVEGVRLMLEVMTEYHIKNVVFSSTAAVYGDSKKGICEEEDYLDPINPYGASKLASENMIKWVCNAYDMHYCIFRYFNVAGADASLEIGLKKDVLTHLIPVAIQAGLKIRDHLDIYGKDYDTKDGTCVRDYIHVSDLARAHVLGAEYLVKNKKSLLVNLGSNEGYSVKEVVDVVSKYLDVKYEYAERREGDPAKLIASNEKAKELLGWVPKYNLDDMVRSDLEFRKKINNIK